MNRAQAGRMVRLLEFVLACFVGTLSVPAMAARASDSGAAEQLMTSGPVEGRINLAILGDGYLATEQEQLSRDARAMLDSLFSFSPYKEYKALFNATLVHVASKESGASDDPKGQLRDTALGAHFFCQGIDRIICMDDAAVLTTAARAVPHSDFVLVVVNSMTYGGAGGEFAVVSRNAKSGDILRHELGHSLAGLADEYETPYPTFPACPAETDCPESNATLHPKASELKWHHWTTESTPLPTPQGGDPHVVGAFLGGRYTSVGVHRPTAHSCIMNEFSEPFCPVCAEAMVTSFWARAKLVDAQLPAPEGFAPEACAPIRLELRSPSVAAETLHYRWSVDGVVVASGSERSLTLPMAPSDPERGLSLGAHVVDVEVEHVTDLVRNDPQGALRTSRSWKFNLAPCGGASVSRVKSGCAVGEGPSAPRGGSSTFAGVLCAACLVGVVFSRSSSHRRRAE